MDGPNTNGSEPFGLHSGYSEGSSAGARGFLTAFGEQIPFGSGGYRGSAPIPYGNYPITPDAVGAWGASHDALGINNNSIYDRTLGRYREGIEMHAGGASLLSEGCLVVPKDKWPGLRAKIKKYYDHGGHPTLHVDKQGASITAAPSVPPVNITYNIQVLDGSGVQESCMNTARPFTSI